MGNVTRARILKTCVIGGFLLAATSLFWLGQISRESELVGARNPAQTAVPATPQQPETH